MNEPVVILEGITHAYPAAFGRPPRPVLCGVDLVLGGGEILGLFGLNGAGKSTTTRIVLGFLRPTGGVCRVLGGTPVDESVRAGLGYAAENPAHYEFLTARESLGLTLRLFASPVDATVIDAVLKRVGLGDDGDRRISQFSKGMKQRLSLAQALVNQPRLLILDEPFEGLDPLGRQMLKDVIREERSRGSAVWLCSHQLREADDLCDRVAILHGGTMILQSTVAQTRDRWPGMTLEQIFHFLIKGEAVP